MICIICHKEKAEVPDRNRMGRPIKRLCKSCHAKRLSNDLQRILDNRKKNESTN
jgi:hypothetical protein